MIKIENVKVMGMEEAIRGMRNPKNSWDKSDSGWNCPHCEVDEAELCRNDMSPVCGRESYFVVGEKDYGLMMRLAEGGPVHAKYRRMIVVYLDITAPLYWWKEFDTYKVGTVANSCSTMHKIHEKELELDDFSHEHLKNYEGFKSHETYGEEVALFEDAMKKVIDSLNSAIKLYSSTGDKQYWWPIIQLLPSSYNQRRTVMLNYEVLAGIYPMRKDHKLDEWREFCGWIEELPCSEIITLGGEKKQMLEI